MVPEIATALTGLAMTVGDSGWSRFAGDAVVVPGHTAERHEGRSLHYKTKVRKNPPFPEKRGISHANYSSRYAERRNAGDGVPYGPNSIRRAEASDRSGGFTR